MLHYTLLTSLDNPELVFGPYVVQCRRRQIYNFVDFCLKFEIFCRFGECIKKFDTLTIVGNPEKYTTEIKNITQALAISELHFHLFFIGIDVCGQRLWPISSGFRGKFGAFHTIVGLLRNSFKCSTTPSHACLIALNWFLVHICYSLSGDRFISLSIFG